VKSHEGGEIFYDLSCMLMKELHDGCFIIRLADNAILFPMLLQF